MLVAQDLDQCEAFFTSRAVRKYASRHNRSTRIVSNASARWRHSFQSESQAGPSIDGQLRIQGRHGAAPSALVTTL